MIPTLKLIPTGVIQKSVVDIIIHPEGKVNLFDSETGIPEPLVSKLIAEGHTIVAIDCFQTGEFLKTGRGCIKAEKPDDVMFTGYNRTNDAWRVQDILTAIAVCREEFSTVNLIGLGEAGIWSLAARPLASGVNKTVVDMARFDSENTTHWCDYLAIPGIRRVGGLKTAAALSAPGQLFMHNINKTFDSEWVKKSYLSMDEADKLKIKEEVLSDEDIVHYLSTHN